MNGIILLFAFSIVWVCFSKFVLIRHQSKTIAIGGGFLIACITIAIIASFINSSSEISNLNAETIIETNDILSFEIVKKEILKKGGQLNPLILPKYILIRATVVLKENDKITKKRIKNTLNKVIALIRNSDSPDAISVWLHESNKHVNGGTRSLASAEWWPKGHSLSPSNAINIRNKATHEIKYTVTLPVRVEESEVVTRLSESKRREIFTELVKSEDKAQAEADAKYDTTASKIPLSQLKTYDFESVIRKNIEKADHLSKKYRKELLKKFKISEEELQKISTEAFKENWPMPNL